MLIIPYEEQYRDDLIFMVLSAKDALGHPPRINPDLLAVRESYADKGGAFFLAVEEGRVVGSVGYSLEGEAGAVLHRLYVKPSLKRRGIGTALLEAAEGSLREKGIREVRVHLGEPKEVWFESYAFYPKHGYTEYAPRRMRKEL